MRPKGFWRERPYLLASSNNIPIGRGCFRGDEAPHSAYGGSSTHSLPKGEREKKSGLALLMVVGIVLILSLISLIYLDLGTQSQQTSHAYLDKERATFLAWSGVEFAQEKIHRWYMGHQPGKRRDVLEGEPTSPVTFDENLTLPWAFGDSTKPDGFDPAIPLEYARYPSLKTTEISLIQEVGDRKQETGIWGQGSGDTKIKDQRSKIKDQISSSHSQTVGLSRVLQMDLGRHILHAFSLKVLDAASMIDINGPSRIPGTPSSGLASNMIKILDSLGEILAEKYGLDVRNAQGDPVTLGAVINQAYVEKGPFQLKLQVRPYLGKTLEKQEKNFSILRNFIIVRGWTDSEELNPEAFVESSKREAPWALRLKSENAFLTQERAPVNINTASFPVLYAVLNGLEGYEYDPQTGSVATVRISSEEARAVAQAIIEERYRLVETRYVGFVSWDELETFIRDDMEAPVTAAQRRLILANALPQSRLNNANWNTDRRQRYGWIDKAHLAYDAANPDQCGYTTEFSFTSGGYYSVTSLGRLIHVLKEKNGMPEGEEIAETRIDTTLHLFDLYRIAAQRTPFAPTTSPSSSSLVLYPQAMETHTALSTKKALSRPYNDSLAISGTPEPYLSDTRPLEYTPLYSGRADYTAPGSSPATLFPLHDQNPLLDPNDSSSGRLSDGYFFQNRPAPGRDSSAQSEHLAFDPRGIFNPEEGTISFWIKPSWGAADIAGEQKPRVLFDYGDGLMRVFIYRNRLYLAFLPQNVIASVQETVQKSNLQIDIMLNNLPQILPQLPDLKETISQLAQEFQGHPQQLEKKIKQVLNQKYLIPKATIDQDVSLAEHITLGPITQLKQTIESTLTDTSTSIDISNWKHGTWHHVVIGWGKVRLNDVPLTVELSGGMSGGIDDLLNQLGLTAPPAELHLLRLFGCATVQLDLPKIRILKNEKLAYIVGTLIVDNVLSPDHPKAYDLVQGLTMPLVFGSSLSSFGQAPDATLWDIRVYPQFLMDKLMSQSYRQEVLQRVGSLVQNLAPVINNMSSNIINSLQIEGSIGIPDRYQRQTTFQVSLPSLSRPGYFMGLWWQWNLPTEWMATLRAGTAQHSIELGVFKGPSWGRELIHTGGHEAIAPRTVWDAVLRSQLTGNHTIVNISWEEQRDCKAKDSKIQSANPQLPTPNSPSPSPNFSTSQLPSYYAECLRPIFVSTQNQPRVFFSFQSRLPDDAPLLTTPFLNTLEFLVVPQAPTAWTPDEVSEW